MLTWNICNQFWLSSGNSSILSLQYFNFSWSRGLEIWWDISTKIYTVNSKPSVLTRPYHVASNIAWACVKEEINRLVGYFKSLWIDTW